MSQLSQYQQFTRETAIYPDKQNDPQVVNLLYLGNGLAGEAGEVSNVIKKLHRDGSTLELLSKIEKEVGDVLWYVTRIVDELGLKVEDVLWDNMAKLESRSARGVIQGSGDNR